MARQAWPAGLHFNKLPAGHRLRAVSTVSHGGILLLRGPASAVIALYAASQGKSSDIVSLTDALKVVCFVPLPVRASVCSLDGWWFGFQTSPNFGE